MCAERHAAEREQLEVGPELGVGDKGSRTSRNLAFEERVLLMSRLTCSCRATDPSEVWTWADMVDDVVLVGVNGPAGSHDHLWQKLWQPCAGRSYGKP
jgi:hypothetical protein